MLDTLTSVPDWRSSRPGREMTGGEDSTHLKARRDFPIQPSRCPHDLVKIDEGQN